jgi:hypothetical protein
MKTIEVTISSDGGSRVETKGFAGRSCLEASRYLEAVLGRRIAETLTSEFHEVQAQQHNQLEQ